MPPVPLAFIGGPANTPTPTPTITPTPSPTPSPTPTDLYQFTSVAFQTNGSANQYGPSLSDVRNYLGGVGIDSWKNNTTYLNTTEGVILWVVPKTGTYYFDVRGAKGGNAGSNTGGAGAKMTGYFTLTKGETLYIVMGYAGGDGTHSGGGGGGTFVWRNSFENYSISDALIIAGGGSGGNSTSANGIGGTTDSLGTYGNPSAGQDAASTSWTRWGVGQAGLFEQVASNGRNWASGPGAGFLSRPPLASDTPPVGSYSNSLNCAGSSLGGNSGKAGTFSSVTLSCNNNVQPAGRWVGGQNNNVYSGSGKGGFGGGGGGAANCGGSGAGGGYSGGQSAGCSGVSGGGGSVNNGTSQQNFSGSNNGNGLVEIVLV